MLIERNNINDIVNLTGTKPDKDYGQNFLIDSSVSARIVDELHLNENDNVLEIGPGLGSLTHFMYQKANLTLVDIDFRMTEFLRSIYTDKVTIINEDIRKVHVGGYNKIIGNLPYNITTELVTYLLINAIECERMVLMCQQEAFNRFFDESGENYGPVSILIHLLGSSKKILIAKPGAFYPAPKCNSLVFTVELDLNKDKEEAIGVYKLTKSLFLNRRKTISNNLKSYLKDTSKVNILLDELKISPLKRPEEISPNEYKQMYNAIKALSGK